MKDDLGVFPPHGFVNRLNDFSASSVVRITTDIGKPLIHKFRQFLRLF
jgi:hypothetical protein